MQNLLNIMFVWGPMLSSIYVTLLAVVFLQERKGTKGKAAVADISTALCTFAGSLEFL